MQVLLHHMIDAGDDVRADFLPDAGAIEERDDKRQRLSSDRKLCLQRRRCQGLDDGIIGLLVPLQVIRHDGAEA